MSERGRLRGEPAERVVRHVLEPTLREDLAHYWAPFLWIQRAHAVMLSERGILGPATALELIRAVDALDREGLAPESLDPRSDLFFSVEGELGRRVGDDAAGRLHTGRSRNDLQATYQRMAVRERILDVRAELAGVRRACLALAEAHAETLLPGYTHLQAAQPISLGHWALAVGDSFARDDARLAAAFDAANRCPLGAAALAGTSWPIDRHRTAALLGFDGLLENTLDAVASRDYLIDALAAVAAALTTASRCATDLLLWTTWEFGLVELDDAYAGISSIMPQKKNPGALEHCRARAAHGLAALASVLAVLKGIPFTHTRDTGKEAFHLVFDAFEQAIGTTNVLAGALETLQVDPERTARAAGVGFATVTDLADALVREHGLSFRAAHRVVGRLVRLALERGLDAVSMNPELLAVAAVEVLGRPLRLSPVAMARALDPRENVVARALPGGPAPAEVRRMLANRQAALDADRRDLDGRWAGLRAARDRLDAAVGELADGPVGRAP